MRVEAALTPALAVETTGRNCVVVDVLRATTSIVAALEAGARRVLAVATVEEARAWARTAPGAVLAGERGGVAPAGFALGNSPREYAAAAVGGRTVVLCTTNGTGALAGLAGARAVYAGALRNAGALVARLIADGADVCLVAAGRDEGRQVGLDDVFALGLLAGRLAAAGAELEDGAAVAHEVYRGYGSDALAAFRASQHGRFLLGLGFADDLAYCAAIDVSEVVPVVERWERGVAVIARAS